MYNWTEEDIAFVKKAIEVKNRGLYVNSKQLTEAYNRILGKTANITNCGTCIRSRITELEKALKRYEADIEKAKKETEITVEGKEVKDATIEATPKKKSSGKTGRKKRTK